MDLKSCRDTVRQLAFLNSLPETMTDGLGMIFLWIGFDEVLPDGAVVFEEGDDKDVTGAVLLRGRVSIARSGGDAVEIAAPELLGEMQQLTDTAQRTATVTAVGEVELLRFEWHELVGLAGSMFTPQEQMLIRDALAALSKSRAAHESSSSEA
ncbi:MAG: hypothetical protein AMXMBFR84_19820 [Candidatus Hydrogenedentota bacterium]